MGSFRKKPVVIEAWQNLSGLGSLPPDVVPLVTSRPDGTLAIKTLEGEMLAQPGDWVIRGVKGELYPCKPDIFLATYEEV